MSLVTYFRDDVSCRAEKYSFPCCSVPDVSVGILVGTGNTSVYQSLAVLSSFDKFCYTRIQVSVKDLDPSIIL